MMQFIRYFGCKRNGIFASGKAIGPCILSVDGKRSVWVINGEDGRCFQCIAQDAIEGPWSFAVDKIVLIKAGSQNQAYLYFRGELCFQVSPQAISFIAGVYHNALLVKIVPRNIILEFVAAARRRKGVVLDKRFSEHGILPVGVGQALCARQVRQDLRWYLVIGITPHRIIVIDTGGGIGIQIGVVLTIISKFGELVGIQ